MKNKVLTLAVLIGLAMNPVARASSLICSPPDGGLLMLKLKLEGKKSAPNDQDAPESFTLKAALSSSGDLAPPRDENFAWVELFSDLNCTFGKINKKLVTCTTLSQVLLGLDDSSQLMPVEVFSTTSLKNIEITVSSEDGDDSIREYTTIGAKIESSWSAAQIPVDLAELLKNPSFSDARCEFSK